MAGVRATGGGRKSADKKPIEKGSYLEALSSVETPKILRDENAIDIWESQSEILIARGVLTKADLPILLSFCNSFSLYLQAEEMISQCGLVVDTLEGGLKKHPALNARQDAINTMMRTGSLLGLDPLSRTKLFGGGNKGEGEENPFKEFL